MNHKSACGKRVLPALSPTFAAHVVFSLFHSRVQPSACILGMCVCASMRLWLLFKISVISQPHYKLPFTISSPLTMYTLLLLWHHAHTHQMNKRTEKSIEKCDSVWCHCSQVFGNIANTTIADCCDYIRKQSIQPRSLASISSSFFSFSLLSLLCVCVCVCLLLGWIINRIRLKRYYE